MRRRWRLQWLVLCAGLAGCGSTNVNLGVTVPIGRHIGVGVGVDSSGRVSTGVGVSVGGGSVRVNTQNRLADEAALQPIGPASAPTP